MEKKPTSELDYLLENMKPKQLGMYYMDNKQYLINGEKVFYYYMKDVLYEKGMKLKEVYLNAGISGGYGGKVIRMEKHSENRDLIIRLCIGGRFSLVETNRALKLYGVNELYSKDPRDACIIVAIKNHIFDVYQIDDLLSEHGFDKITTRRLQKKTKKRRRIRDVIFSHLYGGSIYFLNWYNKFVGR